MVMRHSHMCRGEILGESDSGSEGSGEDESDDEEEEQEEKKRKYSDVLYIGFLV